MARSSGRGLGAAGLRIAEENALLVVLISFVGVLLVLVLAPYVLVADSWLTLVSGREVIQHGLPSNDTLTVFGQGRTWTDQQWLAQVFFYAAERLAGIALVSWLNAMLVLGAFAFAIAAARMRGASARSVLLVGCLVFFASPWGWQVRAQSLALPLFVATVWLLVDGARRPSSRTMLVLPLLVVWANIHGSVVLGAALVVLFAIDQAIRHRGAVRRRAFALLIAPALVLVSPYGPALVHYYYLLLVDPPFGKAIREWQTSRPAPETAVFYVLGVATLLLLLRYRKRLTMVEWAALGLTLAGAVDAIRGIVWFAFLALVLLPSALDGLFRERPPHLYRRLNRGVSATAVAALVVATVVTFARPGSWFLSEWPDAAVQAVKESSRDGSSRVYASDRHADWLLWELPELRGRVAYDVRFELYTREQINLIARFNLARGDRWERAADGYQVLVIDSEQSPRRVDELSTSRRLITFRSDNSIAVFENTTP